MLFLIFLLFFSFSYLSFSLTSFILATWLSSHWSNLRCLILLMCAPMLRWHAAHLMQEFQNNEIDISFLTLYKEICPDCRMPTLEASFHNQHTHRCLLYQALKTQHLDFVGIGHLAFWALDIRVRWIWSKMTKLLKIKTGHLYSYVKLNFKASLFSCIFWFSL